jgi:hypothetical protein
LVVNDIEPAGVEEFDEYAPVCESGAMWQPRSKEEAAACLEGFPAGGTYTDGDPFDGITHIVKRYVRIERGEWVES